ncbi:MAG: LysM peptidoglycan-binding domain-containing protein [Chloroflexi bacterium]|nr:LysM peptidoglycan-binding domain-containing protein [Chloroflexota bacterium]
MPTMEKAPNSKNAANRKSGPPPLNETIVTLLAPGVLETIKEETTRFAGEELETGGILVGRWLDNNTVLIVAATEAGPKADHQRLTFAIDVDYANVELERLTSNFVGVDYIGDWHKHPPILDYPSSGDLRTILNVFKDPSAPPRLITPISVHRNSKSLVNFFHISRDTRQFEQLKPRLITEAQLRDIIPVSENALESVSRRPTRQVTQRDPSWWVSQSGLRRLEDETARLERVGQIQINDPIDESTWLLEILPSGYNGKLKIRFECSGRYDLSDNPSVTAFYNGEEFPVLSPLLAIWDQTSRLDQVAEEIKHQVSQRQRRPIIIGAISVIVLLVIGLVIMAAMLVSSNATTNSNITATANAVNLNKNVTAIVVGGNATAIVLESNNKATAAAYAAEIAKINATKSAVDAARATVDTQLQLTAAALGTPLPTFTPKPTLAPIPTGGVKRPVWHNVTVGQNIQRLAAMYDTTVKVIVEANRNATTLGYPPDKVLIDAPDSADPIIHVGDKLAIPVGRQEFKGFAIIWSERNSKPDELQKLEKDYGVTIDYLLSYNGITSMIELKKSDPLLIPYEEKK